MSTQDPRCNSLKPKKLPVETPAARTSGSQHEPLLCGMKFCRVNCASELSANAVSRPCNPASRRAMLMRKRKVGKGGGVLSRWSLVLSPSQAAPESQATRHKELATSD